jgi:hypothetical protein
LGAVLYKMGKVRVVLYRKLQPNTTTHNNQHELPPPYPPAALSSLSPWVEQWHHQIMAPPLPEAIHRPRAVGLALTVVGLLAWGGRNERHQKIERGGSALALGGRRFINYTQQSNRSRHRRWRGSREGHPTRAECVGGRRIFALVVELIDKN